MGGVLPGTRNIWNSMLVIGLLVSLRKAVHLPPFDGTMKAPVDPVAVSTPDSISPGLASHASSIEKSCARAAGAITKIDSAAAAGNRHENPTFICILRFDTSFSLMRNYR